VPVSGPLVRLGCAADVIVVLETEVIVC